MLKNYTTEELEAKVESGYISYNPNNDTFYTSEEMKKYYDETYVENVKSGSIDTDITTREDWEVYDDLFKSVEYELNCRESQ